MIPRWYRNHSHYVEVRGRWRRVPDPMLVITGLIGLTIVGAVCVLVTR